MRQIGLLLIVILVQSCLAQQEACLSLSPSGIWIPAGTNAQTCSECGSTYKIDLSNDAGQCCQTNTPSDMGCASLSPAGFWIGTGIFNQTTTCSKCGGIGTDISLLGGRCCKPMTPQEICQLPKKQGTSPCKAIFERYYYDRDEGRCLPFEFRGCTGGNANNFVTEAECNNLCGHFHVLGQVPQDEFVSDCPSPNGFFADALQCDKYYECTENVISEKLCPDGMAFNDLNPKLEKCDFLYQVDCANRPDLQPALGASDCPRANGYFPHPDVDICNVFNYCSTGIASTITCPENLVFSPTTGTCTWPDQSGRSDCDSETVLNFTCPVETVDIASAHPRYADPNDCRYFFVCISGVSPRHNGCEFGEVFSSEIKACDAPATVPECETYYYEYFDEYFATLGAGSNRASTEVIQAALNSNYPVPENAKIRLEKPRINSNNRRRKPTAPSAPAVAAAPERHVTAVDATAAPRRLDAAVATESPATAAPRPAGNRNPIRRRRPGVRRKVTIPTTTTTTTEPPPPEYYYDYEYPADYYEDIPTETCTYYTTDNGLCSPNPVPGRVSVGVQRCTDGSQCYIEDGPCSSLSPPGFWITAGVRYPQTCAEYGGHPTGISQDGGQCCQPSD